MTSLLNLTVDDSSYKLLLRSLVELSGALLDDPPLVLPLLANADFARCCYFRGVLCQCSLA